MAAFKDHQVLETPVGQLKPVWGNAGLLQSCEFVVDSADHASSPPSAMASTARVRQRHRLFEQALEGYFLEGVFRWDLDWLDWSRTTPFQQRVLRACYQIPAGHTVSYGELASQVDSPRAARAVGGAMARNRWPLLIPCHRVLGTAGQLTGYSGTGGTKTKRWLLEWEQQATSGQVPLAQFEFSFSQ